MSSEVPGPSEVSKSELKNAFPSLKAFIGFFGETTTQDIGDHAVLDRTEIRLDQDTLLELGVDPALAYYFSADYEPAHVDRSLVEPSVNPERLHFFVGTDNEGHGMDIGIYRDEAGRISDHYVYEQTPEGESTRRILIDDWVRVKSILDVVIPRLKAEQTKPLR